MTDSITPEDYDLVSLGSGEAGKYLAWTFAKQGLRTAVIERRYIGGSCPNIACMPSKNVIHGAKLAYEFAHSESFGLEKDNFRVNPAGVRQRKRQMVEDMVGVHLAKFEASGAELVRGSGRFIGPGTIEVTPANGNPRILRGKNVILSTGTRAKVDPIPGLVEAGPLTHVEALELDVIPEHLLVLGGGYVGLEFAQAMRRFGSRVTVVERNERLIYREDPDVSDAIATLFTDEGIDIRTGGRAVRVEGISGKSVKLTVEHNGVESVLEGSHLLVASGRVPNTENIGLELAGVKTTAQGYIQVNPRLETTAPGVWAVGDCAGSPHFTHIAYDDFRIVRDNIRGGNRVTTGRQVPFCLFIDPELARVGLSETEAKQHRIPYRLAKLPMIAVLRTRTLSETRGFMKALVDTTSDRILGFTAFSTGAGETIATVQIAMLGGVPYTMLRDAILTHPTLAEGLVALFEGVPKT
jgi:pyruvate/2-oxoglutarate dehydrogenase complex dihydrolipoamide dehydrogenase (E3) component